MIDASDLVCIRLLTIGWPPNSGHPIGRRAGRGSENRYRTAKEMSSCRLLVVLLCFMSNGILLEEVIGEPCTEGFMDYSLLQDKATTPSGALHNNRLSDNNLATMDYH